MSALPPSFAPTFNVGSVFPHRRAGQIACTSEAVTCRSMQRAPFLRAVGIMPAPQSKVGRHVAQADVLGAASEAAGLTIVTALLVCCVLLLQRWRRGTASATVAELVAPVAGQFQTSALSVRELPGSPRFGAEVLGLDLGATILPATARRLRDLLHQRGVLLLRNQEGLRSADLLEFASVFGQPAVGEGQEDAVGTYTVKDRSSQPSNADFWHSDNSYIDNPAGPTFLYAIKVPQGDDGTRYGDTLFSDTVLAARELPESLRAAIQHLDAAHNRLHNGGLPMEHWKAWEELPDAIHPVLRRHPFTDEEALFLGPAYVRSIADLSSTDSQALLDKLHSHALQPCYLYRHQWQQSDLVVWDNGRTLHKATTLEMPRGLERTMWRVQTFGPGWR